MTTSLIIALLGDNGFAATATAAAAAGGVAVCSSCKLVFLVDLTEERGGPDFSLMPSKDRLRARTVFFGESAVFPDGAVETVFPGGGGSRVVAVFVTCDGPFCGNFWSTLSVFK